MSSLQNQQAAIRNASWQQQNQLVPDQQTPPGTSSGLPHHLEPLSQAFVRKSKSSDIPSGPSDLYEEQRKNQSARDGRNQKGQLLLEDIKVQKGRLSSGDVKLKGHLGHLAAAVAQAHRTPLSGTEEQFSVLDDIQAHAKAKNSLQPVDVDVYCCRNCDKMFCQQEEYEQHNLSCNNLS